MADLRVVHLKRSKRLLSGHLWVFSNELYEGPKRYEPGSIVRVHDRQDNLLGIGYINPNSLIAVRLLTREDVSVDEQFFRARLVDAINLRKRLGTEAEAVRLVYSEGDYLPGLIVDRYGDCLVIQLLTLGMDRLRETIVRLLDEILSPAVIVLRNDSRSRGLEGLPLFKEVIKGTLDSPPVVKEDGLLFEVDPLGGQKTGFFLDQKENRKDFAAFAHGGRGLDLFCYSGGWALPLAAKGVHVTGVDDSADAVELARRNAGLNNLQDNTNFVQADVFRFLEEEIAAGEGRYDCVVLDPPAFTKSAGKVQEAVRAYRKLNEQCMRLVKPGGIMATSSCSYHIGREVFLDMLTIAARDAGRRARLFSLCSQGRDHPVLLAMPETEYLKCAFLVID